MSKVLIVDDEQDYCDELKLGLSHEGHEVRVATSGRRAIDLGTRYRPDVVVADWMLKNHIHGLHVAHVLRAVFPELRVILITGFPSDDLRNNAAEAGICDFVEKPFGLERMRTAMQESPLPPTAKGGRAALAVIEVDSAGSILFANQEAGRLFAETRGGREAASLADLFSADELPDLDAAVDRWVAVAPRSPKPMFWHLRTQEQQKSGGRLVVLRRQDEPVHLDHTTVDMLLGSKNLRPAEWPFEGRVLVLDPEPLLRKMTVSMLEGAGIGCYAAQSSAEALRLLEGDEGLRFVILDYDALGDSPRTILRQVRALQPDVAVVGISAVDRRNDFDKLGVEHFLFKPWRIDNLINVLTGRLGNCIECGLPLPLRRPKPGDQASSWACAFCGARYWAILDADCASDLRRNVQQTNEG